MSGVATSVLETICSSFSEFVLSIFGTEIIGEVSVSVLASALALSDSDKNCINFSICAFMSSICTNSNSCNKREISCVRLKDSLKKEKETLLFSFKLATLDSNC